VTLDEINDNNESCASKDLEGAGSHLLQGINTGSSEGNHDEFK
jgi:hypothetical protein